MEREVSDTEGVFSRRLTSNWAELPTTLRRRQKHRPDILNQFTDYSESSENELHKLEPKAFSNVQRIVRRSEFLRRLESGDLVRKDISDYRRGIRERRLTPESPLNRLDEGYWRDYDNQDLKSVYRKRSNFMGREMKSLSDEDRKTNSPDSLLIKSSESELSSDEYGHTDDSGAFLEQASHPDKPFKTKRSSFIKFFAKDGNREKKKQDSEHLDVNKNIKQGTELPRKEAPGQKFEYENIPRIDVSRLEQKSFLHPIVRANDRQPTIEQLRLEEGCELRNCKNVAAASKDIRETRQPVQQKLKDDELKSNTIQELYDGEQVVVRANGERKAAKMETITEENADGNKLSVREILKRFEELRTQSEATAMCNDGETEEKTNDKTLTTIQETLKKLDEKVKNYQVANLFVTFIII